MQILHIDFETFSACELKDRGMDNYAKDPTTGVHCMAFAFDDGPVSVWGDEWRFKQDLLRVGDHVSAGGIVYAHNAAFELAIWNNVMAKRYGWPELKPEQVRCTLAMCYAMAMPGKLENAAPALGVEQRKDTAGARIMMKWCKPKSDGTFWKPEDDPEQFKKLCDYCAQDVVVERAMHKRLMELNEKEQKLWALDYKVNNRGVLVDLNSVDHALALVDGEKARLNAEMLRTTGGVVGSCSEVQLLVKWIRSQGVEINGVAKADVLDALSGDLPDAVRKALALRKEAAKSSTAKLVAMKERAGSDGRIRNMHQYHGAATGRWAGRGVQLQNLSRPRKGIEPEDVANIIAHLRNKQFVDMFYGPTMDAIADSLRGMLIAAPGHDLIACDFSAIEARVLAWLAGEESVLEVFRTHGKIYEKAASGIYRVPIEDIGKHDPRRQIGKVAVLALGYGGGQGAFQQMARGYGVKVKDEEAEQIKTAWREAHPAIVRYWYALEEAALLALQTGNKCAVGPRGREVIFLKKGSFIWCRLPSGRTLCYPYPEIRTVTTPWGAEKDALTYMTELADVKKAKILPDENAKGKWQRISTYGGSLAENVTQAVARDLLAEALFRLEDAGFPVIFHVHDEAVVEIPSDMGADTLKQVETVMSEVPSWASGLPIAAEGWRNRRYRK